MFLVRHDHFFNADRQGAAVSYGFLMANWEFLVHQAKYLLNIFAAHIKGAVGQGQSCKSGGVRLEI